jgi:flagellar biosynthesis repressor protein FlbT
VPPPLLTAPDRVMALKLALKPREKLILGGAVIINGDTKTELAIENTVPLLRGKDILSMSEANTPCKRIYFIIQLMYVNGENISQHHETYWRLVKETVAAAPSTLAFVDQMSAEILAGRYYQALKLAKQLIAFEEEITHHARNACGSVSNSAERSDVRA